MLRFDSTIKLRGVNPYVLVSRTRSAKIRPGWRKPMPVLVRINGQPKQAWRINMMPVGDGSFYLYLAGVLRKASEAHVGDRVQVQVRFDDQYHGGPIHPMPTWFKAQMVSNPAARRAWKALVPSRQKEILRYLFALKSKEARDRNTARMIHILSGNKGRFLARDW